MRRALIAVVMVAGVLAPTPSQADPGHARPRITRFEFTDKPLKSGGLERIVIVAHDPNSWISEIQLRWEDDTQSGGVIFAHTYCVQDPKLRHPGTPAKLKLDVTFDHPGTYHVETRAISEKRCEGGNDTKISRTLEKDVVVADPHQAFSDPDDSDGPLDVMTAEQTLTSDEAGLDNHIVHTLTMSDDLGSAPLTGADDYVEFFFDTDDVAATSERTLVVDADSDGVLQASMRDSQGTVVGTASVTTDGTSLSVDFARKLLGRGVDGYRWYAVTYDGSSFGCSRSPCDDRAPDSGSYSHRF